MNPDVFITIAFTGIAIMVALAGLFLVAPQQRREDALVRDHESKRPLQGVWASPSETPPSSTAAKTEDGAAGH